jgi:hypothetical protein
VLQSRPINGTTRTLNTRLHDRNTPLLFATVVNATQQLSIAWTVEERWFSLCQTPVDTHLLSVGAQVCWWMSSADGTLSALETGEDREYVYVE